MESLYGPHTVDRLADSNNKKLNRFNSKFFTPGTSGVDAFAYTYVIGVMRITG